MQVAATPLNRKLVYVGPFTGLKETREDGLPLTALYSALDESGHAIKHLVYVQVACIPYDRCRGPQMLNKLVLDHNLGTRKIHESVHHAMYRGSCCWFLCERVWVDRLHQFPLC